MKLVWLIAVVNEWALVACPAQMPNAASSPWEQPAAEPGRRDRRDSGPRSRAHLTIRNLSTISNGRNPRPIRRLLEQDLKTHGVLASGAESANAIPRDG